MDPNVMWVLVGLATTVAIYVFFGLALREKKLDEAGGSGLVYEERPHGGTVVSASEPEYPIPEPVVVEPWETSYKEAQKVAKELGIRANQKHTDLIDQIREHRD